MADIPVVEVGPDEAGPNAEPRPRGRRLRPVAAGLAVLAALALVVFAVTRPAVEPVVPAPPAEPAPPGVLPPATEGGAGFVLEVGGAVGGDLTVPYDTFMVTALPGDTLALRVRYAGAATAQAQGGALEAAGPLRWTWTAPPSPGVSQIALEADGRPMVVQAVTLVPFDHSADVIEDYAIGDYQDEPMGGDPIYDEPPGFVRVTSDLEDLAVSPHFRLGQFVAKQETTGPKYLVLSGALLLKLERLLGAVNAAGVPADDLTVMSGFRTPAYNAAIGNTTVYSRHLYGDAADVFVDTDGDGMMDDVDGDGAVTQADAEWLANLVEGIGTVPGVVEGGIGIYGPASHRGPFVHVDTRGSAVRW